MSSCSLCAFAGSDGQQEGPLERERWVVQLESVSNYYSSCLTLSRTSVSKPAPDWVGTAIVDGQGRYLVLLYYPLDFTFVCPTEVIAFSERVEEFRAVGPEVVACFTDSQFTQLAWYMNYISVCITCGTRFDIGVLRQVTLNDLPVGHSVDETLRLVQALKHTDTQWLCPAGWTPGGDAVNHVYHNTT
uniref:thioredoxin-dependent peroxiredoxin n=1 Tax=Hucho hucho TaxID=62062 RepID=A0A4W5K0C2_9TELE